MCVGLSARVVSVKGGSAVIDATGARRTVSAELLDDLEPRGLCNGPRRDRYCQDH